MNPPEHPRRIYPLSPRDLSEEQLAVVFAMTSRRPQPFDEIALEVSKERAAGFHERWVLGYGHASVAEHAVLHLAVENVSRLACDTLEDNRLASYTEKSSRFQIMPSDYFHVPQELEGNPELRCVYVETCHGLFRAYEELLDGLSTHLRTSRPRREKERVGAYNLRIRRLAIDSCRFILPAATLTNVGVTMNARSMEHAVTKLLSAPTMEERELGEELKQKGRQITPTLVKYADFNPYLADTRELQEELASTCEASSEGEINARLVSFDPQADVTLAAALAYRFSNAPHQSVIDEVRELSPQRRQEIIGRSLQNLGPHDSLPREFELVDYVFELVMDYGAYREYKRHRMQSYFPQPLTVVHGAVTPPLIEEAGLAGRFDEAVEAAEAGFWKIHGVQPAAAPYLVTHAHRRRALVKLNARECFHLFKLRIQRQAHFTIQQVSEAALKLAVEAHPWLFRHLALRDYPRWWPFVQPSAL